MQRLTLIRRASLVAIAATVTAFSLAGIAHGGPAPPSVPTALAVQAGHKLYLVAHARGFQTYRCEATPSGFEWSFVEPFAILFTKNGKFLGTHFRGPAWMALDGSYVYAQRVDGVVVDPTAISWLLLERTSSAVGFDGKRLTATTYIQRINTAGGLAPAAATCNAETDGDRRDVPYTADYTFWKAAGA